MGNLAQPEIFRTVLMKITRKEILSLDSLKIGYVSGKNKNILLPPLSAQAYSGEMIAVIGRNGIGKSTLLRTLTGLQQPFGGEIYYEGNNIKDLTRIELAQKAGYISTEIVKVSNMRVYDLVALGRFPHTNWIGKIELKDQEAIANALEMTSIQSLRDKFVSELSDGERQKTMIARILAQDTGTMIMDEPTAFLDVAAKYDIFHLLRKLSGNNGKTVIFSTHDLQTAISQSDKIWLILDDGLIEGAPEDLIIAGSFDHLFKSSTVLFNSEDGTFSFRSEPLGSIYIEGEGIKRYWTEKAINRTGFTLSKEKSFPYIITPSHSNANWQFLTTDSSEEFSSIYELISYLNAKVRRAT
jgi:iron complex transport system ATP-binding protein